MEKYDLGYVICVIVFKYVVSHENVWVFSSLLPMSSSFPSVYVPKTKI
jgi:hypothetical protein